MTPKEQYEARKAERQRQRDAREVLGEHDQDLEALELLDRFVTAIERIADALEKK